jgi:hypothetical protein
MMSPYERIRLMKELKKTPEGNPLAKWEAASQWLTKFEDSDNWAIVMMDGDRNPCVTIGFILECVWRSDWVAFDTVDGYDRLLAGFREIPETLPTIGSPGNYYRGAWIFEAQSRSQRRKTLQERRNNWRRFLSENELKSRLDLSLSVGECNSQQLMEALMLTEGRWNNFDPEPILTDLYQNQHLWLTYMMLPLIGESEDSNRLFSNLGLALRDLGDRWHADTLYIWSRDDDCVYPLVDFGKTWLADDVQVMDRDRASIFIGYGGSQQPPPVVIYWWD